MWKYLNRGISTPIAITIISILVIAVGCFTWWQYEEIKDFKVRHLGFEDLYEKEDDEVTEKDSEIAGWETYQNPEMSFSIEHPDLEFSFSSPSEVGGADNMRPNHYTARFYTEEKTEVREGIKKTLMLVDVSRWVFSKEYLKAFHGRDYTFQEVVEDEINLLRLYEHDNSEIKKEDFTIDGISAVKVTYIKKPVRNSSYKQFVTTIYTKRNEYVYQITAWIDFEKRDAYLSIFNDMLSTFKFIKKEKREISDIKWFYNSGHYINCPMIGEESDYRYPNNYDEGDNNYQEEAPQSDFYHIISIPFHNSNKILRAYLPVEAEGFKDQFVRLVIYDQESKESNFIGDVKVETGSNYGGIFLPYQIVKDDSKVILKACMGSPGAGGGSVDLGYKTLSFENSELNWIAKSGAHFYDSFGKVVYVSEGDNTPQHFRPGPSNNAAVYFRDIIKEEEEILLEEKDSSYKIIGLNENLDVLNLEVTKYYFSEDCPRKDGNLYCAETSKIDRFINLP